MRGIVEVSAGGSNDILSFYCTTSATTWKDPGKNALPVATVSPLSPPNEEFGREERDSRCETGFSKNAVARYQSLGHEENPYETTYRRSISDSFSRRRSNGEL